MRLSIVLDFFLYAQKGFKKISYRKERRREEEGI